MEKTRKWRKILAMMLTVVMMLQNAQSVMVFADVTNEQIEQRLAGNQGQTEETQPAQSQVDTRANGEEYKTQSQETQENGNGSTDIGSPESGNATTEAKTSNADVSATITQSVFQADVSGTTCNFVQMTAQITNNDAENPATGVSVKALLNSAQLSWVNGYGTETAGAGAYAVDSNNTADLPDGSADGYDQIVMWTDQTIGAGETVAYQFAAQIIPENLDGVVNAWYVNGTSCNYTWENTEVLNPVQTPEADQEETPSDTTQDSNQSSNQDSNQDSTQEATPTPEVTETSEATPIPEVTETPTSEVTKTPEAEPTQAADDKKAKAAKKKNQQRLLAQRDMADVQEGEGESGQPTVTEPDKKPASWNISDNQVTFTYFVNGETWDGKSPVPRDATIDFHLEYTFDKANMPSYTYYDGFYYELPTLPAGLRLTTSKDGEILLPNGITVVGSYRIDQTNGRVYFTYDREYVKGKSGFTGTFDLYVELDKNSSNTDYDIDIGGIKKITFLDSDVQGEKSYTVGDDGYLYFTVTLTATDADVENVTVTDTLTGNLTFDENWNPTAEDADGPVSFSETPTNDGKTATFKIAEVKYGKPVTIKYKVKPISGTDATGTNTASWTWGENGKNTNKENAESTVDVNNHKISKTSVIEKDADGKNTGKITYTVVVNELAANLIPDSSQDQWIKFVDTLPSNVKYVDGTLTVKGKNNEDLVTAEKAKGLTLNGNTIELQILDGVCAVISYQVRVIGKKGETVTVENTAQLTGNVIGSDKDTTSVSLEKSNATFSGIAGTAQFVKKDYLLNGGKIVPLKGAKFDLYKCSLDENRTKTKVEKEYVSDSTGTVIFGSKDEPLETSTLYCFRESELQGNLKDKYILDDKTEYYFVLFSDNDSEAQKTDILNKINKFYSGINVASGVNDLVMNDVSNYKIPTSVKPKFNATKILDNGQPGNVTFEFVMKFLSYDSQNKGYQPSTNLTYNDLTANNDADGSIEFPEVELKYPGKYQFEVYEKDKEGYVKDNSHYIVTYVVNWDRDSERLVLESTTITKDGNTATPVFNNYTSTGLTITKNTETPVDSDTEFKFKLTGAGTDFSGLAVDGNVGIIESRNGQNAIVKVTIPKGNNTASVKLTGLLKGAEITVQETETPAGWHLRTYEPASANNKSATITLSGQSSSNIVTVTNYYKETGEATFKVTKNFNGWTDNPNQKFTFNVSSLGNDLGDGQNPMPEQPSINLSGNSKTIKVTESFGKLSFEQLGNYYYKITETIPPDVDENYRKDGITYDPKVTYVKVEVVKGTGGTSTVNLFASDPIEKIQNEDAASINAVVKTVNGSVVTAPFTNSISEASITFKATKRLTGRTLKADEFTFVLANADGSQIIQTAKNDANGNIKFNPIGYKSTDAGDDYTYTIYEQNGSQYGVKYDDTSYKVTVHVRQNSDGTLNITCDNGTEDLSGKTYAVPISGNKTANFVNEYETSTSIQFTAIKDLKNKELPDSNTQFEFSIEGYKISNGKVTVNNTGRKIEFPQITYTQEDLKDEKGNYLPSKTYDYTIKEVVPEDAVNNKKDGITYASKSYTVHVVLSQSNGQLNTTVKIGDNANPLNGTGTNPLVYALTENKATFVNEYSANDIQIKLVGKKYLENQKLVDDKYIFKIEPYNGATPVSTIQGDSQVSNKKSENANITFPDLKITLSDMIGTNGYPANEKTFKYRISEVKGSEKGVTYSKEQYLVEIKVINTNGKLTADGTVEKIQDKDGKVVTNKFTTRFTANDTTVPTVDIATGENAFTNSYHAKTTVQFKGTKALVDTLGNSKGVSGRNFEFEISGPKLGENGAYGTKTVSVNDNGTFEFPAISYDVTDLDKENENYTSKRFNYTIKEVVPKDAEGTDKNVEGGVTYDKTSYNVVVTITNDIQTGTLTQKVNSPEGQKVTGDNGVYTLSAGENKATFTNRYDATTKYTFTVEKQLAGRKFKDGDNFRFALLKGRTELQTIELKVGGENGVKVETDENGNQYLVGTFDAQEYGLSDVGKSYEYTIRELNPKKAMDGVTTDEDIYIVDVAITDNGDGTLKAEPKRVLGDKDKGETKVTFDKAVFTNKYQAEGTALIVGKKFLSPGEIGEEKFEFTLSQLKEDGTTTILQKKENIGNVIEFDSIPYKTEDEGKTFWYIVQETTGTNQKYAYDNSVYKVKVVVSMDPKDNRKLIANQTIYDITGKQLSESGEEAKAIVFTNRYEAAGSITLTGKKVVEGTDKLKAGEFKFEVKEGVGENAKVVATGTNDENGNITFSEISYAYNSKNNDLGEHVYTVTEVQPKDGDGYVYDLTSRKVVVKVTDNQDKTLKAEIIAASEKDAELKSDVTNNVINSFINKQISITIRKNDANKARLADAELALFEYDNEKKAKTGDAIDTWTTSKDNDHTITGKLVAGKTYILEETKAPDGYAEANPIIFTIKNDGVRTIEVVSGGQLDETGKVLIMVDQKTGVQILKVDEKGKGVPGAELAIFDGDKQIGASWTTDGQAHVIEGLTAGKIYTLKELKAPSGYKKAEDKTFTIDASKVVEVRMEDKTIKLSIMKVDGNGQGLKGADLEIRNKNNELIDKWTSETTEHVVDEEKSRKLVEGEEYTLIETKAPEGYALANPKTFTIKSSDTVTKVTMENVPNSVIISKKSLTGIESIGGAKLRVLDPQGNEVVKTWTTEKGKDKAVTGVFKPNVTYTLEEVEAPEGYRKAANIMFSLNETGEIYVGNTKVTSVVMRDALTKASILKVDESGKGIAGADLVIKDSKGNIKATWTSDGTPHAVEGVLKVGETYTLSETKAPSGYTVAPDQTFKMEDKDVIEVTMVDYQASGSGQITVTKKVTYANGGDFIDLIAQDDTFYVNLFTDAAGKYPYKGALPQAIHLVNASAGSVTFSDLAQGTYYVYETDANGNVINLDQQGMHNGSQFMCTVDGGSNIVKLDLKAGPKEGAVNLENVFFDIPTGYSYKGEININKQVLKGTTQTTTDDTFYAGVFTKGDDGVYNLFTVVTLVQNDTVTVEVPLGGKDGTEPINYYILETDADGNILDLDVFEYEVTGEGTVALSKDNLAGNINLVNKIPEDTDGKLRVQKTDGNGVGLAGASFRLTDEDGSVIDEWTSEASAHELELEPGTYTLTEVQAPTGYTGAGSVTIKVDDDYNFSVSGEIDYSYKGGLLKIVNKATTSTPSSGTPVSGGSTPASYSSALSGKVAVKTGDNTPIGAYAAVLVIAALAIAGGIFYKKKRKNDK